jgi:hypothetical protein
VTTADALQQLQEAVGVTTVCSECVRLRERVRELEELVRESEEQNGKLLKALHRESEPWDVRTPNKGR